MGKLKYELIPALSIKQPWAELILAGFKDIEVRFWSTNIHGLVWLHTGINPDKQAIEAFKEEGFVFDNLTTGAFIGRANLYHQIRFTDKSWLQNCKRHLNWGPLPKNVVWGWMFSDVIRFKEPIPGPGALRFFYPNDKIQKLLLEQVK